MFTWLENSLGAELMFVPFSPPCVCLSLSIHQLVAETLSHSFFYLYGFVLRIICVM